MAWEAKRHYIKWALSIFAVHHYNCLLMLVLDGYIVNVEGIYSFFLELKYQKIINKELGYPKRFDPSKVRELPLWLKK